MSADLERAKNEHARAVAESRKRETPTKAQMGAWVNGAFRKTVDSYPTKAWVRLEDSTPVAVYHENRVRLDTTTQTVPIELYHNLHGDLAILGLDYARGASTLESGNDEVIPAHHHTLTLAGDSGTPQTITTESDTLTVAGTEGVQTTAAATDKVTAKLNVNGLTADASPSLSDYVPTWDVSASLHKKVLLSVLLALLTPISIANGGTGQTTNTTAFDALAPASPAKGDILVHNGTHWVKLSVGTDGDVLTANSAATNGIDYETPGGGGGGSANKDLYLEDTPISITNTTTETSIYSGSGAGSLALAANWFASASRVVEYEWAANIGVGVSPMTVTFACGLSGTMLVSRNVVISAGGLARIKARLWFDTPGDAFTSTFVAEITVTFWESDLSDLVTIYFGGASGAGVDTTGALTLDATVKMSAADASNHIDSNSVISTVRYFDPS